MGRKKVILIGAGQLGSRYLQGLVSANCELLITVVDSSIESLENSRHRWVEAGGMASSHKIRWQMHLPIDLPEVDLALVVTSSRGRATLVQTISDTIKVRFWVLEKVLAQSKRELGIIHTTASSSDGAWVNTPRKMMPMYQSLSSVLSGESSLAVSYAGGLWGLACNSIHFIDLVAWLSGESLHSIDFTGLSQRWYESKRLGYFDLTGELRAQYSGGTTLRLSSEPGADEQTIRIGLENRIVWEINEQLGCASSSIGEQISGRIELQSQLSGRLVDDILRFGRCELPTLGESVAMHEIFIKAMLTHWNRSQHRNDELIPIT